MQETRSSVEKACIGAMLIESRAIDAFTRMGGDETWFSLPSTKSIAKAILELYAEGKEADIITVDAHGCNLSDIDECVETNSYASNIEHYTTILKDYNTISHLNRFSDSLQANLVGVTPDGADDLKGQVEHDIHLLLQGREETENDLQEIAKDWLDEAEDGGDEDLLPWMVSSITRMMGKVDNELIWISALPSAGKTALVLQWMRVLADDGKMSSLASLESKAKTLVGRLIASIGRINTFRIQQRKASKVDISRARRVAETISPLIRITDHGMSVEQLYAWARQEVRKGTRLIIIDNTRHIRSRERDRVARMELISQKAKQIRDDLNVPVVMIHHSKLDSNGNEGVSWSSDIERDTDVLIFLSNNYEECPEFDERTCVDFKVKKNRDGESHIRTQLEFQKEIQTFIPWMSEEEIKDIKGAR